MGEPRRRGGHRLVLAVHGLPPVRLVSRLVGNYEVWRGVHRTTGVFVAIGFAHGLGDATTFAGAPVLRWTYVAVGGTVWSSTPTASCSPGGATACATTRSVRCTASARVSSRSP